MVIEFITSQCYKSHELAQVSLLWGTVAQMSNVAHGPLVETHFSMNKIYKRWNLKDVKKNFDLSVICWSRILVDLVGAIKQRKKGKMSFGCLYTYIMGCYNISIFFFSNKIFSPPPPVYFLGSWTPASLNKWDLMMSGPASLAVISFIKNWQKKLDC